jgi:MFS family permease
VTLGDAFAPLAKGSFRLLWLGRVTSAAGDALMPLALAFAVLSVHHSATALGLVLATHLFSRVAFTLVGGVVADRLPRREVMLACDGARAIVQAFTAAMLLTHQMTLPLFFVTTFVFGAASAFFTPAADGLVPQTVGDGDLQRANALLGLSQSTMNVFGPALSGILIATTAPGYVFAIDAVSFAASAAILLRLRIAAHERAQRSRFLIELREGLREVTSRPWVRAPIVGFAISNFCFASFIVLGPVIFQERLGGAGEWGFVSTCGALGAILGSIASAKLRPRRPLTFGFTVAVLLAAPIAALARPLPVSVIAAAWFLGMGSIALSNTYWETNLQRRIPAAVFARVRSYDILVSFIFMPLGFVAFPLIAQAVGTAETLLVAAAVCAATSLVVAFAPAVREVVDETEDDATLVPAPPETRVGIVS